MSSNTLLQRALGNTGWNISTVGFGAWAIGADWGQTVPEGEAADALHAAIDAGMNFIDTADIYGAGRSEKIVGRVIAERSERIYVATKMGRGDGWTDRYDAIARAAQDSCDRLGVDQLDLVQLHCIPTDVLKAGRAFEQLEKIKAEGLIAHYGVSVETIDEALFVLDNSGAASLQVIFNLFRQRLIDALFPKAREQSVGIIARVPLASGVLTGKFTDQTTFDPADHRHFNADGQTFNVGETFAGVPMARGVDFAQEIATILEDENPEATLAQKSLRWILDFPEVSTVIPGAKNPKQAKENATAALLEPFSSATHSALRDLYRDQIDGAVRGRY